MPPVVFTPATALLGGPPSAAVIFQLRFDSLFHEGRALSFPCDEAGRVRLDGLSPRARDNYLYARAVIGREYAQPRVVRPS